MTCDLVRLPDGVTAIVCSGARRQRCACGRRATLLCDWKQPTRTGTCSVPICARCTTSPAPDKDLCPAHAAAFVAWKAARGSGDRPDCGPHPHPDATAARTAIVSAPEGRSSRNALAADRPENAHG